MNETMINGWKLSDFNAHLLGFTVGDSEYSDGYMKPSSRLIPIKLASKIGLRKITMTVDFEGESLYDLTLKISQVTAMLRKEAKLFLPDGFSYWCEFDGASTPKQVAPWILQVQFSFSGFRHQAKVDTVISKSQVINVFGNYETPAKITVTLDDGVTEFTVFGITVKNASDKVIIDGINAVITDANGNNKFKDAPEMTAWPMLQPGLNSIDVSEGVQVEISYYPIYQ